VRDKIELVNKLHPFVNELNSELHAGQKGEPVMTDNKVVQIAAQVPKIAASMPGRASAIEQKVEQGSDNVARVVIEVRARTEMVKGMARAFLLPGLTRSRTSIQRQKIVEYEREQAMVQAEEIQAEPPRYEEEMIIRR
jgi:hypothetical protein